MKAQLVTKRFCTVLVTLYHCSEFDSMDHQIQYCWFSKLIKEDFPAMQMLFEKHFAYFALYMHLHCRLFGVSEWEHMQKQITARATKTFARGNTVSSRSISKSLI